MEHRTAKIILKGYFLAVAVLMHYFLTEAIEMGLWMTYRHALALVLFISATVCFLLKPNITRGISSVKPTLVYSLPMFVTLTVSLFIWFVLQVDTYVINRGLSSSFVYTNMLSSALAAAAMLYIFGEKGIWYNLVSILISNILNILVIITQYGFASFMSELITLIVTFAGETGEIIVQAEIHELAFCLGAYLVYMLLKPRKNFAFYLLLILTVFCFLVAFKRIAIVAIAIAVVLGWALQFVAKFSKVTARNLAILLSVVVVIALLGYIAIIKMDIFSLLEEIGIETSGRDNVYNAVDKYYTFSLDFLGNGIGFLTYQLNTNVLIGVSAVHNDFLQYFIDLGFWGYIVWLIAMILVRVCYFGAKGKTDHMIVTFALSVYLVVVSATDNTMSYPLLTTALAVIMIGQGFDETVRDKEKKMFGYVSNENRQIGDGSIL